MTMNTNRMIELALVFFVSLLSFSIGTYVGKKYSDNQHRLAVLEPQSPNKDVAHSDVVDHGTDADQSTQAHAEKTATMTDADVAKLAEEFATEDETTSDTKTVTEITEPAVAVPAQKVKSATLAAVEKVKQIKVVSPTPDLRREVASIAEKAKTMGSSFYTVQVGAYTAVTDATKMMDSLKARGYKASSVEAMVNGKTYYRVQVGLFDSLQAAQDYKKELIEQNRLASAIIQKIQK